ncbi:hypothetical protein VE03_09502 [Pseudogymnoascus sp. 23342-1-I1]|nr:hypothetical protein VE03_09502 [Pseudogymnoascus sp. 23342-1-I1]
MIVGQSRQGKELSGIIAHESVGIQDSQTLINGNTAKGPITNYPNIFAVPMSTGQEYQGLALAGQPDCPVVRMNHNGLENYVGNHPLQDYQTQLMLLEQQNKRRLWMARAFEEQVTALQTIPLVLNQLNIAHISVKELLANLPTYFQNIEDFKSSIPQDIKSLQGYEEKLYKKEAEIKALENRYNELIQMTPEAQQGELQQVRDKAMLTMQQDREGLTRDRDNTVEKIEEKNGRIEGLEVALGRSRELMPELIEDLKKLALKLRDVQMDNSNDSIGTIGDTHGG